MIGHLDSNLTDAEKIAEVKRQLAEQGITDAKVTLSNGWVEIEVEQNR